MVFFDFELVSPKNIFTFVIGVFLIFWILTAFLKFSMVLYLKKSNPDNYSKTSIQFLRNSIKFIVGIIALLVIIFSIPVLRSKANIIFSGAGILAAIIGFAAQSAISNLVAGVFIVIFKPFRVGDYIKLDDLRTGIVEDINLRHTIINNFENKRLIIPNSVISTESVLNHTIEDLHILSFNNFNIGLYANIDLARKIIQEEVVKNPKVIDNRTPVEIVNNKEQIEVRVISTHNSSVHLRAYAWVVNPLDEFQVKCELRGAIHKRFISEGIEFPKEMTKIYMA